MTKYEHQTFTPDGSAQLWVVALYLGPRADETFTCTAPVVGWFDVTEWETSYHTPAVHEIYGDNASGVEPLEDWAEQAVKTELCHVSQLAEVRARYDAEAEHWLKSKGIETVAVIE